ncbi:Spherulation-specific family 4 [Lophiotrema nucula]|uniref:Spherulation-specific family 4 n=1 Tax=Lophiotrema nucula TaxID=690887 RepID=A0A6A5Z9L5_9PLEO|nr:Spherulation-specific family 4 [Lophiotrema nucula]
MFFLLVLCLGLLLLSAQATSSQNSPRQTMDATVLVPLYVYPTTGAWEPVIEMASSFPRVHFTAIINPQSGPGEGALPNENYTQAIQTLNALDNVRTIGYVATTWCSKNLSSVLDEIAVYAGWGSQDPSLAMSGIFFDETPTLYTPEYVSYLQAVSQAVHSNGGLQEGFVVHNPGALPEARYFSDPEFAQTVDLTVVFEDAYVNWTMRSAALIDATKTFDHEKFALLLHSVPALNDVDTEIVLVNLMTVGHSVFLTGSSNYTAIDSYWPVFVNCLDTLLG